MHCFCMEILFILFSNQHDFVIFQYLAVGAYAKWKTQDFIQNILSIYHVTVQHLFTI